VAKKVISYKLNMDGTIPDYVEDGGYLPKDGDLYNMVLLGVSKDGADISGAQAVFDTQPEALAYVRTYRSDVIYIDPTTGEEEKFILADAIADLFAKLN
jgi:hypothetical protein